MKTTSISEIPNSLNVKELMGIKGGRSDSDDIICNGSAAVYCENPTPAIAVCEKMTSAVFVENPGD